MNIVFNTEHGWYEQNIKYMETKLCIFLGSWIAMTPDKLTHKYILRVIVN